MLIFRHDTNPKNLETVSIASKWVNTGESFLLKYNNREYMVKYENQR